MLTKQLNNSGVWGNLHVILEGLPEILEGLSVILEGLPVIHENIDS